MTLRVDGTRTISLDQYKSVCLPVGPRWLTLYMQCDSTQRYKRINTLPAGRKSVSTGSRGFSAVYRMETMCILYNPVNSDHTLAPARHFISVQQTCCDQKCMRKMSNAVYPLYSIATPAIPQPEYEMKLS